MKEITQEVTKFDLDNARLTIHAILFTFNIVGLAYKHNLENIFLDTGSWLRAAHNFLELVQHDKLCDASLHVIKYDDY